jgi:hypothetical protein
MNERETPELRHLRPPPRARSGEPNRALDNDPIVQAPPQCFRRPPAGHAPTPFFARRSATRADSRGLAGAIGPSLYRPAALLGFNPSQVHSRPRLATHL